MGSRTGFSDGRERPSRTPGPPSALRGWVQTLLGCLLVVLFLRTFVFQQSEIPSGSMEDTILIGDYVLVNRFLYAPTSFDWERRWLPIREIERGDVVVFKHPFEPEQDYIKRVIALPGDSVAVLRGVLVVNGTPVEEPYVQPAYRDSRSFGPLRVPPDQYFVLGDHRNRSSDSREWGLVSRELMRGRAILVLLSADPGPAGGRTDPGRLTPASVGRRLYAQIFHARWDRVLHAIR